MIFDNCLGSICFVPFIPKDDTFFGFTEFISGFALTLLIWTIADVRYKFRVKCAPFRLQNISFALTFIVGFLVLLTDLWVAQGWASLDVISYPVWQAILAFTFFVTLVLLVWFSMIRPPSFSKYNYKSYASALYRLILKGNPSELAIIADDFSLSVREVIRNAPSKKTINEPSIVDEFSGYANDLLLLIADKRFCRAVVDYSPSTILEIFKEMNDQEKSDISIQTFGKNIMTATFENRDSFIFHEAEGYESGLIGYHKPLSKAIFANYKLVEDVSTLLDPDYSQMREWDKDQWSAFCRLTLITFESYVNLGEQSHSFSLHRAFGYIEQALSDLSSLDKIEEKFWNEDVYCRISVITGFVKDAIEILNNKDVPNNWKTQSLVNPNRRYTPFDRLAKLMFELIHHASYVTSPSWTCWTIQHNSIWNDLYKSSYLDCPAGEVVKFKLRRLLYDEVCEMKKLPNYKGARILAFCINVMGIVDIKKSDDKSQWSIQKPILIWLRKNYLELWNKNKDVAQRCLIDNTSYDSDSFKIVKIYPSNGLRTEAKSFSFEIDVTQLDRNKRSILFQA